MHDAMQPYIKLIIIYLNQKKEKEDYFIIRSDMVKTNKKLAKKIDQKGVDANATSQNSAFVAKQGS